MIRKVQETIEKHNMLNDGETVIAALSGGADSVALLSVLCSLKEKYNLTLYALHVHHGIRGEEADEDCSFCMELCSKMGVELFIKQYDVPKMAEEIGISDWYIERSRKTRIECLFLRSKLGHPLVISFGIH